jgi:hypothetical protein
MRLIASLWTWFAIAAVCAGIQAFEHRFDVTLDGVTYLDMALAAVRNGPGNLINAMWTPLYPGFIAVWFWLLHPSSAMEAPVAHFCGWLLFCAVAAAFLLFIRAWTKLAWNSGEDGISRTVESLFYFSVFLRIFMEPEFSATFPDLALAPCVFLAAFCCVKAASGASSRYYVLLGLALAAAYYSKPSGFVAAVALFAILFLRPPANNARAKIGLALLVFLTASLPLVMAVSKAAGELTTSVSGKLNYLWHVNAFYKYYGWTGQQPAEHGTPVHPPRVISKEPLVLEFGGPVGGTYPLWYDPSYWFAGVRVHYNIGQEVAAVRRNLRDYYNTGRHGMIWAGAFALAFLGGLRSLKGFLGSSYLWILVWPVSTFMLFSAVHLEPRYMAPFVPLLAVGIYSPLVRRLGSAANSALLTMSLVMMFSVAAESAGSARNIWVQGAHYRSRDQLIADKLIALGVERGDRIATVGNTFNVYWAHIAGVRVVAQAPDPDEFRKMDEGRQLELLERLRSLQVKALVAPAGPEDLARDWQELPSKGGELYRVLVLR